MLITVESIDGGGGTSLVSELQDTYQSIVTTAEPYSSTYGQMVDERLAVDNTDPLIDFFLFMCDRRQHIEHCIRPQIEDGAIVVSDRYADSTRAYQPVALTASNGPFDSVWKAKHLIEQTMNPWNYEPDLTLYLDVSVDTAIERTDGEDTYENRAFLNDVRDNYEALCEQTERIIRIDGEQSQESVVDEAIEALNIETTVYNNDR